MKLSELEELASGEGNAKAWLELRWLQQHGWYKYIAQLEAENDRLREALEEARLYVPEHRRSVTERINAVLKAGDIDE